MENTEYIGLVAGILTSVSLFPQLIKIIRKKEADDISFVWLAILITGLSIWIWYGAKKSDLPIILTNCLSVIINILVIFFTVKYRR